MIYLTVNDLPSGVYESQVINKCIKKNSSKKIKIIALIPLRNYIINKKKFDQYKSIVDITILPMFPFIKFWKLNLFTLIVCSFFFDFKEIQGRDVFATYLSLLLKKLKISKNIIHDGRGAFYKENLEYNMVIDNKYLSNIYIAEKKVINQSNFCFSVSNKLVEYWKEEFGFKGKYKITPCKPGQNFYFKFPKKIKSLSEKNIPFTDDDVIMVFSGGNGAWQSYDLIVTFFKNQIKQNPNIKLLLLSPYNDYVNYLLKKYPESVVNKFVKPKQIKSYLLSCDYGILFREKNVTNTVSSPVKFGEYLSCGLKILISENVGDYSDLVHKNNLGHVISDLSKKIELEKVNYKTKLTQQSFSYKYFE